MHRSVDDIIDDIHNFNLYVKDHPTPHLNNNEKEYGQEVEEFFKEFRIWQAKKH